MKRNELLVSLEAASLKEKPLADYREHRRRLARWLDELHQAWAAWGDRTDRASLDVIFSEVFTDRSCPVGAGLGPPAWQSREGAERLREVVSAAAGVVLSTPEYHGGHSSVIKLVIENLGFPSVLAGKPVALLGVAAGQIGAIKSLESLRSICSHVGAIVLPGPVSVAGVQKVFDEEGNCLDEGVEKRVRSVATNLVNYIDDNICPRFALEAMVRAG